MDYLKGLLLVVVRQQAINKRFGYIWNLNEWDEHLVLYHWGKDLLKKSRLNRNFTLSNLICFLVYVVLCCVVLLPPLPTMYNCSVKLLLFLLYNGCQLESIKKGRLKSIEYKIEISQVGLGCESLLAGVGLVGFLCCCSCLNP